MRSALKALLALGLCGSLLTALHQREQVAQACTGGVSSLEWFAPRSEILILGEALEVGSGVNAAPTLTATATAPPVTHTATPIFETPVPPVPTYGPVTFDLTDIGVTIRIVADYSGIGTSLLLLDRESRASIERKLRELESGHGYVDTCGIGAFVPRYTTGARYLIFAEPHTGNAFHSSAVFRVDADRVVFNDDGLTRANNGFLYMERATYDRFFRGAVDGEELTDGTVYITTGSVPLNSLLRAVTHIRGDPSIAPPETGSAGLAANR